MTRARELERHGALLDERRASGFVRQCHGDLHLRNIVLLDGRPTLFDGVEFNDKISCTDVLYDLAFLLMDLWRRGLPRHANAVWNRYLADTGDLQWALAVAAVPLLSRGGASQDECDGSTASARRSPRQRASGVGAANTSRWRRVSCNPPRPCLLAIGGFSGTGKSTLALGLAPSVGAVPGAVVIRSDEIRKRLCGVSPLDRLGPEGYSSEMSERVYATVAERAEVTIRAGHSAIVDAVYARPRTGRPSSVSRPTVSVPFVGMWLEAPESTLIARAERRRNDASDADAEVIRMQHRQGTGVMTWHRVEASLSSESVLESAMRYVQPHIARWRSF